MPFKKFNASKNELKKFRSQRLVGIEWEYNYFSSYDSMSFSFKGHNVSRSIKKWIDKWGGTIHTDSSCGEEIITPPVGGDHAFDCIKELGEAMLKSKVKVDNRCSVHVHVDAKDLSIDDIKKLAIVYSKVEPLLYIIGGHERYNNDYCYPIADALQAALNKKVHWKQYLSKTYGLKNSPCDRHDGARYKGLNLVPWLYGKPRNRDNTTVEFRIHKYTDNWKRIVKWAELCSLIVDYSKKSTTKTIDNLSKYPVAVLVEIAPHLETWIRSRIKSYLGSSNNPLGYKKGKINVPDKCKRLNIEYDDDSHDDDDDSYDDDDDSYDDDDDSYDDDDEPPTNSVIVKGCNCEHCGPLRAKEIELQKKQYLRWHSSSLYSFFYNDYKEYSP